MSPVERVLPADVFDALELSALAFGGIGAGAWYEDTTGERYVGWRDDRVPFCAIGHAEFVDAGVAVAALKAVGIDIGLNDISVQAINLRKNPRPERSLDLQKRVPFRDWCSELGVVRGE